MTDLDRAEQAAERAANFHRLVFEYAKEQAAKQHLYAPRYEWQVYAAAQIDAANELFAGIHKDRDDLRENYDETQRANEADFKLKQAKEAV